MAEYIDREKVKERLIGMVEAEWGWEGIRETMDEIFDSEAPAEDVAPVRHAHWELVQIYKGGGWQAEAHCSNCFWEWESLKDGCGNPKAVYRALSTNASDDFMRNFVIDVARKQKLYGWCPQCGAKMDEVENL